MSLLRFYEYVIFSKIYPVSDRMDFTRLTPSLNAKPGPVCVEVRLGSFIFVVPPSGVLMPVQLTVLVSLAVDNGSVDTISNFSESKHLQTVVRKFPESRYYGRQGGGFPRFHLIVA